MAGIGPDDSLMSEINVTPFVDVMLVLLIIFMVTAPMLKQGEEVSLPETEGTAIREAEEPLVVTVTRDGAVWLGSVKVEPDFIRARLGEMVTEQAGRQVLLKADTDVAYGVVMQVMSAMRRSGVKNIGMLTQPVARKGRG